MANRFPLIFNSGAGQIQELAASDNLDLTSSNLVNAGILFTSSGSQTAPSISIGNGTTYPPGLYSPGTDQLAVATNGTRRLIILSDGKVGLGAASVLQQGSGVDGGSAAGILELYNGGTGNTTLENTGAFPILFKTNGSERLRITSAGLVGIGDSGPSSKLDVTVPVNIPSTGSPDAGSFITVRGNTTTVGYGPSFALSNVSGAKETSWRISAVTASGNNGDLVFNGYNGGGDLPERMRITAGGLVGIGATSPSAPLNIASTGNGHRVLIDDTTNDNTLGVFSNATDIRHVALNNARGAYKAYAIQSNGITFNATNGSASATIDTSGRLLVGGTSTARDNFFNAASGNAWQFQVEGTDFKNSCASFTSNTTSTGDGPHLILARSRGPAVGSNAIVSSASGGDSLGLISFQGADGSKFVEGARIEAFVDGTPGAADMPGRIVFATTPDSAASPTERMRITAGGLVGIGTTSPSTALQVNGTVTATTFQSTSDINLKENIKTVNNSLNIVSQLRGVTFDWKNTHQASIGVIAQEVEQILPELVSGGENKTVNYNGIIGILVEAIKEQEVRIEKLENKLNAQ